MISVRQEGDSGPIARRIQLGAHLRRLRRDANVTREAAGWHIRGSDSKISRMELGRVPFKERDVADLLSLYGAGDEESAALLLLARQANIPGWWQKYGDLVPPWFLSYLGLEDAACLIRAYEVHAVPALLQTAEYTRALIRRTHPEDSQTEINRRVEVQQRRQAILHRSNPPHLWAVLDEAVLRRRVVGRDVMRAQIQALAAASRLPHVRVQVVSFERAAPAAAGFPFTILRFGEQELPDVVYLEQLTSATFVDKPSDVEQYAITLDRSCLLAASPERTADILDRALTEPGERAA
ncbi:helix-turn-helix domain-containing protein [Paractinoplanes rishiriensis]|uniref:Transcriptional regulator n=1 Tax=Paractinoplanes rishiriensis TaxID=1050105 RepID=A0A919K7V3_9ACTN|nr:helix-turn-helix transcriptional regulator [Actinoplanes rishiriensis]GIF01684.1 transcriptional regulator [Actinoplanes rishiriensis]